MRCQPEFELGGAHGSEKGQTVTKIWVFLNLLKVWKTRINASVGNYKIHVCFPLLLDIGIFMAKYSQVIPHLYRNKIKIIYLIWIMTH